MNTLLNELFGELLGRKGLHELLAPLIHFQVLHGASIKPRTIKLSLTILTRNVFQVGKSRQLGERLFINSPIFLVPSKDICNTIASWRREFVWSGVERGPIREVVALSLQAHHVGSYL